MMNRRRFLATAGTILTAIATGCSRMLPGGDSKQEPSPGLALPPADAAEPRPFRVALLSDVHIQPADSSLAGAINGKLRKAVGELKALEPDLWVTNGDIADHGVSAEHEAFKQIMAGVVQSDRLLVTTGNHEFYDMETTDDVSLRRFKEAFGKETPYSSHVFGDTHFVMLADEQWKTAPDHKDWCWITPEQIHWFERVLAEHRDKLTCVFMHQPLNETVASSQGAGAFGSTNMAKEIYDLLGKNPQVKLWFSGHTHRALQVEGQVVKKGETTFVALGSTIYLLVPPSAPGERFKRDSDASQTRVMDIFPDKVVIRARDHAAGRWMDDLTVTMKR
jgi:3',5'-cyclic-AMP phosphodiesterase